MPLDPGPRRRMLESGLGDYPGTNRDFGTPFQKSVCGGPAGLVLTADTSLR
jgi:hypothetical protein